MFSIREYWIKCQRKTKECFSINVQLLFSIKVKGDVIKFLLQKVHLENWMNHENFCNFSWIFPSYAMNHLKIQFIGVEICMFYNLNITYEGDFFLIIAIIKINFKATLKLRSHWIFMKFVEMMVVVVAETCY